MENGNNKGEHPLNNQKITTTLVVALVLILGIVIAVRYHHDHNSSVPPSGSSQGSGASATAACSLFSLSDAKGQIGGSATMRVEGPLGNVSTASQTISDCYYSTQSGNPAVTSYQTASLEVIQAKNSAGVTSNQNEYATAQKTAATTEISGLGDKAYYSASTGQLEALTGNYYLLCLVDSVSPSGLTHSESSARQIVQTAIDRL